MNRRERLLAIGAALAIGVLAVDAYVISPIADAYRQLDDRRVQALDDLREARSLMQQRRGAQQRWREMVAAGLSDNASVAESQVLHAMRSWAADADLSLASMTPERRTTQLGASIGGFGDQEQQEVLHEIDISARASGSLEAVARLCYEMETATVPVRIRRIRLVPRSEASDVGVLNVELRASTLYRERPEGD